MHAAGAVSAVGSAIPGVGRRRARTAEIQSKMRGVALALPEPMRSVLADLRFGVRALARSPGSSAVAILALALGIGANTAIFSLVEAALLAPLPYRDADRLVQVWEDASRYGFPHNTPAPANFFDWKAQNQVFEDMAASRGESYTLTGG